MEPFGLTIFCDDIRHEIGGKTSLIGCYNQAMLVPSASFPIILPKLAFSVSVVSPKMERLKKLELLIYLPGDHDDTPTIRHAPPLSEEGVDATRWEPSKDPDLVRVTSLTQNLILSPVEIKSEGNIKVRINFNGTIIKAGTLPVICIPSPTTEVPSSA